MSVTAGRCLRPDSTRLVFRRWQERLGRPVAVGGARWS